MTYLLIGLILILMGSMHKFDLLAPLEVRMLQYVQKISNRKTLLSFIKEIWYFGRTSFSLILLVLLILINWKAGLVAAGVFLIFIGIEYLIKTLYFRKRPFSDQQGIDMLQPLEPMDSSFPSGDTMRAWYLALIIPAYIGDATFLFLGTITLATLVTLGRLVLGVHYLTDTLAGAGLGILGAGSVIWLWFFLNII